MSRKPLFSGLDVHDTPIDLDDRKTANRERKARFEREQYAESRKAHLVPPAVLPHMREIPGAMHKTQFDQPRADLVYKRSKGAPVPSKGTPSVPVGMRKSANAAVPLVTRDGRRRQRSHVMENGVRSKSAQKVIFNGRVGMSARPANLRHDEIAGRAAVAGLSVQAARVDADRARAAESRADAKRKLNDAIGRERDALARGDNSAAASARAEIRQLRKLAKFKGE